MTRYTLSFDGACEPRNPGGTASYGVILLREGVPLTQESKVIGHGAEMTNNVAEYHGLIRGLQVVSEHVKRGDSLEVIGDSQLVIRQMRGEYAVRASRLIPLHKRALELVSRLRADGVSVSFKWVTREQNAQADRLSHSALIA